MSKFKKNPFGSNYVLDGDGFYISYRDGGPVAGIVSFSSDADQPETALVIDGDYKILNGDYRHEYSAAFSGGLDSCLAVFNKYRAQCESSWSTKKAAA